MYYNYYFTTLLYIPIIFFFFTQTSKMSYQRYQMQLQMLHFSHSMENSLVCIIITFFVKYGCQKQTLNVTLSRFRAATRHPLPQS